MTTITIEDVAIKKEGGFVILSLKEYRKLREQSAPVFYLSGKEAERADALVKEGLDEYRSGKTVKANSVKEALEIYA